MVGVDASESASTPLDEVRELRLRVAQLEAEAGECRGRIKRQSEDLFRLIADAVPAMIWMSGPDAARAYHNRQWLAFRGRTPDQETGRGWAEGVHPEDRERVVHAHHRAFECRREFEVEYRLLRTDGEYRWVADRGAPRCDRDGLFAGFVGCAVDIHEQRAAEPVAGAIPLTARERQVLVLIAEGKTTKETAATLGISYKTADSHRSKIMEKLDVHETASLVRYAIRQNLIRA